MEQSSPLEQYLLKEAKISSQLLPFVIEKIQRYNDIYADFSYWLEHRNYDNPNAITINGYTAKRIYELNPNLDGIGVFNFLVTLREDPDQAEQYVNEGFTII